MTITDTKVVTEIASIQIWTENEAVLINLVRVIWNVSHTSCKGVFCNHVSFYKLWSNIYHFSRCRRSWL